MVVPYQRHQKIRDRYHNRTLDHLYQNRYKESDDYDALLSDAKNIPFWIESEDSDSNSHDKLRKECLTDRGNSTCCFWDLLGRPVKHNEEKTLFDYQQIIVAALEYFLKIRPILLIVTIASSFVPVISGFTLLIMVSYLQNAAKPESTEIEFSPLFILKYNCMDSQTKNICYQCPCCTTL